jgi:photosystem II stability/assembly factor-like uncharacterized protein
VAAIQFVSPQVGWAAGAGRIVATTDGGARWSTQLTTDADFGEVDFLSSRTGWAVGDHELLGTADGGRCWRQLAEPDGGSLRMVHFATPTVGFGVAGGAFSLEPAGSSTSSTDEGFTGAFVPVDPRTGGVLVETDNGGRSWSPVPSAPANAQSVCFVNGADGWLGAGGGLYRTTDGGQHWAEVADPGSTSGAAPDGTDIAQVGCGAPTQVWVASDTGGAAAGNSPWAVFASTTGTGATLLQADMYPGGGYPAPPQTPGSYPGAVSVIGSGLAAVTGFTPAAPPPETTKVEVLNASGQQVEPARPVAGIGQPWGLAFLSATDGWVVGYGTTASGAPDTTVGVIEHTTNGGSTWTVQDRIGS